MTGEHEVHREHDFHVLYWHFGQYGRQDVHLHPCPCGAELVGPGRDCDGNGRTHKAKTLTDRSTWSRRENEGKPL